MTRTKNRPGTAPSAAHAAPDPAPAPDAAPAPDSPAAAVHAALAASPGSTVAVIADAAGTSKPAVRDALLAMEKNGTATRARGGRPGIPDTWTLADAMQDNAVPAGNPEHEQGSQPGDDPSVSLDAPGDGEAVQDPTSEPASLEQQDSDTGTEADPSAAPGPETEPAEPHHDASADDDCEDTTQDDHDAETAPCSPQDTDVSDGPREGDAASADSDGKASDTPDPALITDLTERIAQIKAAADAATTVLTGDVDLRAALAGLDEIADQAGQARRSLKAAITGRKGPAVRPGGLRDKVLAHLDAHPDGEFTPHEIHKVNGHSSGAIANALETLVKLGDAEVATEKPRRFRRAAKPAEAAPRPGVAVSGQDEGTKLAGAA